LHIKEATDHYNEALSLIDADVEMGVINKIAEEELVAFILEWLKLKSDQSPQTSRQARFLSVFRQL
jgi:hypothetical protein|tara:strand:+ start:313 stop:510 length:198 start_codon:yes stop_codon:yes gene_type:complete